MVYELSTSGVFVMSGAHKDGHMQWGSIKSVDVFFQAEDGIRDSVASSGLGDVYEGQDANQRSIKCMRKARNASTRGVNGLYAATNSLP